MVANWFWCSH